MDHTASRPGGSAAAFALDPLIAIREMGKAHEWQLYPPMVLGRSSECGVRLDNPCISGEHAEIVWEDGRTFLRDKNSRHGVWVNDARVSVVVLTPGLLFSLADTKLYVVSARMVRARTAMIPYLGWGDSSLSHIDHVVLATIKRSHLVLWAPPGSEAEQIARLVHEHGPGAEQSFVEATLPDDAPGQQALLERAENGTLVVHVSANAAAPSPDSPIASELRSPHHHVRIIAITTAPRRTGVVQVLPPSTMDVAVATLSARPADVPQLVPVLVERHERRVGRGPLAAADVVSLLRQSWQTLEDLSLGVMYLLAVRSRDSLRDAEAVSGVSKSALQKWLASLEQGDPSAHRPPRSRQRRRP